MERTLEHAYQQLGLAGGSVLLAVSGGADSRALLVGTALVRERLALTVEVATLDHGLRSEARAEGEGVARLAARWGLPCHARALHLTLGPGLEARAREARYAALEALRRERGLRAVATAHTASDQAETLLMRLARGSALRGAVGIHRARPFLVRPLIECTREQVEAFLEEQGVSFVVDPMNADLSFFRTRIRQEVLPGLSRAAGFPVTEHLATFARLVAEDEALLSSLAEAAWRRLHLSRGTLDAVGVRALEVPLRRRVLARLLFESGAQVDDATLTRALRAVESGRPTPLSQGLQLRTAGGRVRCVARSTPSAPRTPLVLAGEGASGVQEGTGWSFSVASEPPPPGTQGLLLPGETHWPLTVRTRQPGDRVRGRAGSRKLQDVLVDGRIPAERREALPVVVDAEGNLLWVPGVWSFRPHTSGRLHLWAASPNEHAPWASVIESAD
jgi:tRNA(Ile)-lysidine synthase